MATLVVQSRFAGLKIEDEEFPTAHDGQKSKKNKVTTTKKTEPPKKVKSNISSNKPQSAAPKKKKTKQNAPSMSAEQWELWKQKDEEMVDGNFESELQQAIMLSKLDFEEKKDVYKQLKKDAEMQKKLAEQNARLEKLTKKQKKKTVMSLDQFNGLGTPGEESKYNHEDEKDPTETKSPDRDTEFFERIVDDTKNELLKDKINDRIKDRQNIAEEVITRIQFADALERKNKEIAELKQEILSLKQELLTVKSRNKKLCNILGQGEMRDKAEVLVEVERLRAVQSELTAEIATLHIDLEKERSKNADPRAKDKKNSTKKKTIRFDVSAETEVKESSSSTTH